ncbi:MAG: NAD(P)-binding domain-containing protein [Acidimicrobiia bacterium]
MAIDNENRRGDMTGFDVVVIGAGSAGLGVGYHLGAASVDFVIVERGEIGESWRLQRWDSFAVNTPNRINGLPGSPYDGDDPDGFWLRDQLVESFERHAARHSLPIRTGTTVVGVSALDDWFVVDTVDRNGMSESLTARSVVVASGGQVTPKIPAISQRFPESIVQLHAADYRSPEALSEGAVVVIGSGQSGCQIVEDLVEAGRTVYLCTSRVARVPRRYRGSDVLDWMVDVGLMDQQVEDLADPVMQFAAQPQVSGVGPRGRTVSLQELQRQGVWLMGRLSDVNDGVLTTDDGLAGHIAFADGFSAELKQNIDTFVRENGIDVPPAEVDPIDVAAGPGLAAAGIVSLDLAAEGVSTVVWCTGFDGDFSWLQVPATDADGRPVHVRGVSPVPGIYFLGLPWLHTRKSGIIHGIDEDARWIAEAIVARVG